VPKSFKEKRKEIPVHRTLTSKQIAELLGCNESTIRRWVERGIILPLDPTKKPMRFRGQEVRAGIERLEAARRLDGPPDIRLFYCPKCRQRQAPTPGTLELELLERELGKGTGNIQTRIHCHCSLCGTALNRLSSINRLDEMRKAFPEEQFNDFQA
jgi:excisionase family DNA binding protein